MPQATAMYGAFTAALTSLGARAGLMLKSRPRTICNTMGL
jgi:hypothetical protein